MTFSAKGEARVLGQITNMPANFRAGLMSASTQAGKLLVRTTQNGMAGGKSGRVYRHPTGGTYQASAPGEYPAVVSNQLINSIASEVSGARFLRFGTRGAFNKGFDYALHHHERTGRPYLTKAVNETQGQVHSLLGTVTFRKIIGG